MSLIGRAASPARRAASAMAAGVSVSPISSVSAAVARSGRGASAPSAMPGSRATPGGVTGHSHGSAQNRNCVRPAQAHLLKVADDAARRHGEAHRDQQLVGPAQGLAHAHQEIGQRHAAGPALAGELNLGIQRQQRRRGVGRGRGVDQVAADRGPVADQRVGEDRRSFLQRRRVLGDQRIVQQIADRRPAADDQMAILARMPRSLGSRAMSTRARGWCFPARKSTTTFVPPAMGSASPHARPGAPMPRAGVWDVEIEFRQHGLLPDGTKLTQTNPT